eukprot:CAMPEP_0203921702 /NCGR_PEP_ID=MMETSP0359-20131031/61820_1 /ASSEMBLY_ACC=CAM_ASM_000338 /TAXON_ID=268821 /ORGANISM="Scrippsiella Hangoei, Strain SHTV-5" /LENGTH=39 /DNA_ID= /DNA_START= /DNA_END= /DNA_ORIENTATION=
MSASEYANLAPKLWQNCLKILPLHRKQLSRRQSDLLDTD